MPCFITVSLPLCWESCSELWVELCSVSLLSSASLLFLYLPVDFPPSLVTLQLLPIQNQRTEPAGTLRHRITACITSVREKLKPPSHLARLGGDGLWHVWGEEGGEWGGTGGVMWKSWWLRLQWATSPDCVTAGDQHPLGRATEEQLCRVSADSPGGEEKKRRRRSRERLDNTAI